MTATTLSVLISGIGALISLVGSAFIAGFRWGTVKIKLELMDRAMDTMATKEQLAGVKEDVAEIKGMFRITLKDP